MDDDKTLATFETPTLLLPASPAHMMEAHKALTAFAQQSLDEGTDYGKVPGTDRNVLMKPGAERILKGFGCVAAFEFMEQESDPDREVLFDLKKWVDAPKPVSDDEIQDKKARGAGRFRKGKLGSNEPNWVWQESEIEAGRSLGHFRYVVRCRIVRSATGDVIGEGLGSCSTVESKYIRAPRDAENTVLKMAKKRAMVDAVLTTFGLSGMFAQDLDENMETSGGGEAPPPRQNEGRVSPAQSSYWDLHNGLKLPPRDDPDGKAINLDVWKVILKWQEPIRDYSDLGDDHWEFLRAYVDQIDLGKKTMPKAWAKWREDARG